MKLWLVWCGYAMIRHKWGSSLYISGVGGRDQWWHTTQTKSKHGEYLDYLSKYLLDTDDKRLLTLVAKHIWKCFWAECSIILLLERALLFYINSNAFRLRSNAHTLSPVKSVVFCQTGGVGGGSLHLEYEIQQKHRKLCVHVFSSSMFYVLRKVPGYGNHLNSYFCFTTPRTKQGEQMQHPSDISSGVFTHLVQCEI